MVTDETRTLHTSRQMLVVYPNMSVSYVPVVGYKVKLIEDKIGILFSE